MGVQGELGTVEVYDPARDNWSPVPSMMAERYGHASVGIRSRMYVIRRSEVYDGLSRKFARIKSVSPVYKFDSFGTECVVVGNEIKIYYRR